jgi:hypothetical protein
MRGRGRGGSVSGRRFGGGSDPRILHRAHQVRHMDVDILDHPRPDEEVSIHIIDPSNESLTEDGQRGVVDEGVA